MCRTAVEGILADIEARGDAAVRELSVKFDGWDRDDYPADRRRDRGLPVASSRQRDLDDIRFAQEQVRNFAEHQRDGAARRRGRDAARRRARPQEHPGELGRLLRAGRQISAARLGAHVGHHRQGRGRAADRHLRAALQRQAGGRRSSPPSTWPAPTRSTASAASRRSARWRSGRRRIAPVDMLVGPGNAFVAEAKRQLFGRVGIDLFAGPTETLVIADETVDGEICATDLLGQAEHGPNSPAILLTTSEKLARETMAEVERLLDDPADGRDRRARPGRITARSSSATTRTEMVREADRIASEHVQVMTRDPDYFLDRHDQLRRAVPRPAHQRRLWRQGDRHQPHAADHEGGALHGRALGRQVPQDLHLSARADRRGVGAGSANTARGSACWKASSATPSRRMSGCAAMAGKNVPYGAGAE